MWGTKSILFEYGSQTIRNLYASCTALIAREVLMQIIIKLIEIIFGVVRGIYYAKNTYLSVPSMK